MANDSCVLLVYTWQEPGGVNKRHERDIEGITEAYKSRDLIRSVNIDGSSKRAWLLSDNSNGAAIKPCESHYSICRKSWLYLKKRIPVNHSPDHLVHIVRFFTSSGMIVFNSLSIRKGSSDGAIHGGFSILFFIK